MFKQVTVQVTGMDCGGCERRPRLCCNASTAYAR